MKQLLFIAAILAVVINLTACKTQKNFSKLPSPDAPTVYVVDTAYKNAMSALEAIKAEEKKNNEKIRKNQWYPKVSSYPIPSGEGLNDNEREIIIEGLTFIFNIEPPAVFGDEYQTYPLPYIPATTPENEHWLGLGASLWTAKEMPWIVELLIFICLLVGGILLFRLISRPIDHTPPPTSETESEYEWESSFDAEGVVQITESLKQNGGEVKYEFGGSETLTIKVYAPRVPKEVKKVEPEKKD